MLFGQRRLQNYIVPAIAENGCLTPVQLHDIAVDEFGPCTPQAVYKCLSALLETGVLVKSRNAYALNLNWCVELTAFTEAIQRSGLAEHRIAEDLPNGKKEKCWNFKSLYSLYHFWCHLFTALAKTTQADAIYSYNSHAWFYLIDTKQAQFSLNKLGPMNCTMNKVVGGYTYLDRCAAVHWERENVTYCFDHHGIFRRHQNESINVAGEYVVVVSLDDKTLNYIEDLYTTIKTDADMSAAEKRFEELASLKISGQIRIAKDVSRANELMAKFNSALQ